MIFLFHLGGFFPLQNATATGSRQQDFAQRPQVDHRFVERRIFGMTKCFDFFFVGSNHQRNWWLFFLLRSNLLFLGEFV